MKNTNHKSPKKWTVLARSRLNGRPSQPSLLAIAGLCIRPVPICSGAAMKTAKK